MSCRSCSIGFAQLSRTLALTTVAVLVAGACAGTSSSTSGGLSGPIKVAVLGPYTGTVAFLGQDFHKGEVYALQYINANGGVRGAKLEAIEGDTSNDSVDAVNAFHQLELQQPAFYFGPTGVVADAILPLFESAQAADFTIAGSPVYDHLRDKYVFRVTPSDSILTSAMAYYAIHQHYMHAVIFVEATSSETGEVAPLQTSYTAHGGQILGVYQLSSKATDFRGELQQAFATHPDVAFWAGTTTVMTTLWTDMKQLGEPNIPWVGDIAGSAIEEAKAMGLDLATKWQTGVASSPPSGPAYTTFADGYDKYWGTPTPDLETVNLYDSVVLASLAMTMADSADPKVWVNKIMAVTGNESGQQCFTYPDCVAMLNNGKTIDYEGASGALDFNQYHNVFSDEDIVQFDSGGGLHSLLHISQADVGAYAA